MLSKSKNYKSLFTKQQRLEESSRMLKKYPNRRPIICDRSSHHNKDIPALDKRKYLVPDDCTIGDFMYVIRKRIRIPPEKSIFLFIADMNMVPIGKTINEVYDEYKDDDGFLYITFAGESTFG